MLKKVITYVIAIVGVLSLIPSIIVISKSASIKTDKFIIDTSLETTNYLDLKNILENYEYSINPFTILIDSRNYKLDTVNLLDDLIRFTYISTDSDLVLGSDIDIMNNNTIDLYIGDTPFPNDITLTITYQVPQNNLISTLLALIPLVIISGLLGYLLLFNNKENE